VDIDEAAWKTRLDAGAKTLGVTLDGERIGRLWRLAQLLRERNAVVNLTSVDDLEGILGVHVLDSLSVVPHLGAARRVVDVGTGGGFPGLPIAIACPEREIVLIDGTRKKIRFVQEAIEMLGRRNATALAVRAEQHHPPRPYDAVLARAVGSLADIVRVAGHLVARDGAILAMKGKRPDDELTALPHGWRAAVEPLRVPELDAERHLVTLRPLRL
jgi:16S rRNA (guanine527-N7)-methyltransferase